MSLRTFMVLVLILGVILAWQYRREVVTPLNVSRLAHVSRLEKDDVWRIAWSPARDRMAVVGFGKPVEVRDPVTLRLLETVGGGKQLIDFAFSPKDDVVAYSERTGKTVTVLHGRTGGTLTLAAGQDQPKLTFSPDGALLATGGYGTEVRVWRVADGELVRSFDVGPVAGGLTPEFSPDGLTLAVGNRNSTTCLFDARTGALRHTLPKQMSHELQFHPSGRTLAVVYVDGSVALWRVEDGTSVFERKTPAEELYSVDWSPDGTVLATSGLKAKITLWDPRDLSVLRELDAPEWVVRVKFSPDGLNLHYAGGAAIQGGKRHLGVLGVEGSLFSLLNRPRP
jgi:WD40 repeat protein